MTIDPFNLFVNRKVMVLQKTGVTAVTFLVNKINDLSKKVTAEIIKGYGRKVP